MKKSLILSYLSSFLLLLPHVRAVSRLRLTALRVGLAPASRGLTNEESYLLRDTVQYILEDLMLRNSPNRQTPSDWPDITSIGLERILENSVSSDGVVRLSVDGLVYFSFSGNPTPTNDEFSTYLQEELLTPSLLLEAITSTSIDGDFPFQNFTRVAVWENFNDVPSSAPTTLPTVSPTTLQPTVAPTLRKTTKPAGQLHDFGVEEDVPNNDDEEIIIGAAIAGGIALFLTLVVFLCQKHTKPLQKVSEGPIAPVEPKKDNNIATDKTVRSDEESNIQKSKEGDVRSGQSMFNTVVDTTLDIDDMSDESFGDDTFDDDLGFEGAAKIQPDIVAPQRQDSFGHRVYSIQKDMMESSAISKAITAKQPKSLLGLPPTPATDDRCILEPTDVSAASLAEAGGFSRQSSRLSDSGRRSLVPKPIENMWGQERKTAEIASIDGDSEYSGWDPDDASTIESEDIFLTSNVPNPAEQSLLHHSVRFESYKMQRLRTPENKKKNSFF
mmetsp:Transcript_7721/g.18587  ORF Transcript_7721/g.18587 Transcript_7721/m.18587 type:complete len:499 (+) Transcript_7721:81-1577(+)|eukprot:CAMPEP_0113609908 /NCGR_PEP_ID=MMETSP0017_2-20120614/4740_1 /TAXON_ID=2856 /ORGANISM="Cylindrotheca closterium" /LENGTH=498 /DNA_ID=CAMNT_0000518753 /DNA_START=32 /DNA_END=1528 /DNA_ORIENTATION=- /assembly_acc=CAM_ASM_000147